MATTTTTAIRTALLALISGLSPGAPHLRRNSYRVGSHVGRMEDRADSDLDREFEVEEIKSSSPIVFGATAELDYVGSVVVKIGHAVTGNRKDGMDRRDTDLHQIAWAIEKTANLPAGVAMIRRTGWSSSEIREYWITTFNFEINFCMAYA